MTRKRNHQFSVRLSDEEQALWDKKQAASKLSKTELFIKLLKSSTIKIYNFDDCLKELIRELRKIGVNLNQLTKKANSSYDSNVRISVGIMLEQYSDAMNRIKKFLDKPLLNATIIDKDGDNNSIR